MPFKVHIKNIKAQTSKSYYYAFMIIAAILFASHNKAHR